jgi:hypothetical protein
LVLAGEEVQVKQEEGAVLDQEGEVADGVMEVLRQIVYVPSVAL